MRYLRYYKEYCLDARYGIIESIIMKKSFESTAEIDHIGKGSRHFFFGFSRWKRGFIAPFFKSQMSDMLYCDTLADALAHGFDSGDEALIWGMKKFDAIVDYCKGKNIPLTRVEDGFIRSVALGSDLTRPYSLVVDRRGIYIDPTIESDLEWILSTSVFDDAIKVRADKLIAKIISAKFSKYNAFAHKELSIAATEGQKVILIPGQVEDDASMEFGGMGMDTVMLLKAVREQNPSAYIIYKPHPDVLSGNRKGLKEKQTILAYCDKMVENISIDSCIAVCDEVHTITSTVGFDALIRNKKVFTYGMPFYAGWGLTHDKHETPRRKRSLSLSELVAGVLIRYPRYISPKSKKPCEVEVAFDEMQQIRQRYVDVLWFRALVDMRTFVLRKIRRVVEFIVSRVGKDRC